MKINEVIGYRNEDYKSEFFYGFSYQISLISNENKKVYVYPSNTFLNVIVALFQSKLKLENYELFYYVPILFKKKKITIINNDLTVEIQIFIEKKHHTFIDDIQKLNKLHEEIYLTLKSLEKEKERLKSLLSRDIEYREIV